eukprot:g3156.t1
MQWLEQQLQPPRARIFFSSTIVPGEKQLSFKEQRFILSFLRHLRADGKIDDDEAREIKAFQIWCSPSQGRALLALCREIQAKFADWKTSRTAASIFVRVASNWSTVINLDLAEVNNYADFYDAKMGVWRSAVITRSNRRGTRVRAHIDDTGKVAPPDPIKVASGEDKSYLPDEPPTGFADFEIVKEQGSSPPNLRPIYTHSRPTFSHAASWSVEKVIDMPAIGSGAQLRAKVNNFFLKVSGQPQENAGSGANVAASAATSTAEAKGERTASGQVKPVTKPKRKPKKRPASFIENAHEADKTPRLCIGVSEPELVGKEYILGESYNVKQKFLRMHGIVLGASPISGGWFDIAVINEQGEVEARHKWRRNGLLPIHADGPHYASKEQIAQVLETYRVGSEGTTYHTLPDGRIAATPNLVPTRLHKIPRYKRPRKDIRKKFGDISSRPPWMQKLFPIWEMKTNNGRPIQRQIEEAIQLVPPSRKEVLQILNTAKQPHICKSNSAGAARNIVLQLLSNLKE